MSSAPASASDTHRLNIAAVERETRIGKDTLRVWERRYGFPKPERDANGDRLYSPEQVERLQVVRRLLDAGHRPGRVVPLELPQLRALGQAAPQEQRVQSKGGGPAADEPRDEIEPLLQLVRSHQPARLRQALGQALLRSGLSRFVLDLAVPFLHAVGDAWAHGKMAVFEEHLASDVLDTTLRATMASGLEPADGRGPRVLLSTLQGETHGLGLLMADALFSVEGCVSMNLGCQTPLQDLASATRAHRADIVVLSASAASNPTKLAESLAELRAQLPPEVELWAGMPHANLRRRGIPGVVLLDRLDQIEPELQRWRSRE